MSEEWKPYRNTRLLVSNFGRVKHKETGKIRAWIYGGKDKDGNKVYPVFKNSEGDRPQGRPRRTRAEGRLGKSKPIRYAVHRAVAELYVPFECPKCITEEDWNNTPNSIKLELRNRTPVDHIDRNKNNPHFMNLRWATWSENSYNRVPWQKTRLAKENAEESSMNSQNTP